MLRHHVTLLACAASAAPAAADAPLPRAAYAVFVPDDGGQHRLADDTVRLLRSYERDGQLRYAEAQIAREKLAACLALGVEASAKRRACVRRALPPSPSGQPIVVILVGYTRERGAWQRMECIGPGHAGFERYVYVSQALTDPSNEPRTYRAKILACIRGAFMDSRPDYRNNER